MRYIALKSCRIGGNNYNKGDIIQPNKLSAYEGLKLVKYGILSELPINAEEMVEPIQFVVSIPILSQDGKSINCTSDDVTEIFRVLQMSATDAAEYIKNINSDSVCDVLGAVDTRKTVLAAISKHTTEQEEDSGGDE